MINLIFNYDHSLIDPHNNINFLVCAKVNLYFRDIKDMNANQAKVSVETAKEVMNDKALKTKGDKDRRLREKKQQNTKKFMEERKTVQIKQGREKEKLKVTHEKQIVDLDKDIETVSLGGTKIFS